MGSFPLKVRRIPAGILNANSYLVYSKDKKEGILIDASGEEVLEKVGDVEIKEILITHGHFDHIYGLNKILERFDVGYWLHRDDLFLVETLPLRAKKAIGLEVEPIPGPSYFIEEGILFDFYGNEIRAIHTPGHTPGSVCFHINNWLFTGDTIFNEGVGRTDFEGGDENALRKSIKRILEFPDDTILLPGHGPRTTIQYEKLNNDYVRWFLDE